MGPTSNNRDSISGSVTVPGILDPLIHTNSYIICTDSVVVNGLPAFFKFKALAASLIAFRNRVIGSINSAGFSKRMV